MRNASAGLLALLLSTLLPAAPAFCQGGAPDAAPLEDGCVNEIGVLCRGMSGSRLMGCLDENRDAASAPCRASMDAEHDRLDRERDAREAARQEERLRASLGEEQDARLSGLSGSVYVHTAAMPEGRFVRAAAGTPLSAGDLIRTGADGSADLVFEGNSLIALSPNTDFTVTALAPKETEFHLGLGRFIAKLAKVLQGHEVRFVTPTAVAAVRGTELVIDQPADRPSLIGVLDEGHVAVSSLSGGPEVILKPNQETQVAQSGPPQPPKPLSALQNAKTAIAAIRQRAILDAKQWKPVAPQQRVLARMQLAKAAALSAGALPNVQPAQQKRVYPEAQRRREELIRRRAENGAPGQEPQARPQEPRQTGTPQRPQRPERTERGGRR